MAHRLGMEYFASRNLPSFIEFETVDDTVRCRHEIRDLLRLLLGNVEHLHIAALNFHPVIVSVLIPLGAWYCHATQFFRDDKFHLAHHGLWISRVIDLAHDHGVIRQYFTVVMKGTHLMAIYQVLRRNMDGISIGRAWRPRLLKVRAMTANDVAMSSIPRKTEPASCDVH